jgi:hypothetical protein
MNEYSQQSGPLTPDSTSDPIQPTTLISQTRSGQGKLILPALQSFPSPYRTFPPSYTHAPRNLTNRSLHVLLLLFSIISTAGLFAGLTLGTLAATNNPPSPVTHNSMQQQSLLTSTPLSTPSPTPLPTPSPPPTTIQQKITGGITISPASFTLPINCQPDNGYRCTMTLSANNNAAKSTSWSNSLSGATIHPARGTITRGQHTQVLIYIPHQCPYHGTLTVTIKKQRIEIPLSCA